MNNKFAVSLIVVAFFAGLIGGGLSVRYFFNGFCLRSSFISESANVGADVFVLDQLQTNNVTGAIRMLNTELDGSLIMLWFFRNHATTPDRKTAEKILKQAQEYRNQFPYRSGSSEIDLIVSNALSLAEK